MSKIFLFGAYKSNTGPANVNSALIRNHDDDLIFLKNDHGITKGIETLFKVFFCDIIVISGLCSHKIFRILKCSNKKIIYLMHGCVEYENKINKLYLSEENLKTEYEIWEYCDLILCVSEKYADWFKKYKPAYQSKTKYINNGVEICLREQKTKRSNTIALSGGNRNIKNNGLVCKAVQLLNRKGINCSIELFGRMYDGNEDLLKYSNVNYHGHLSKEQYYTELDSISLYIVASELEPFGLVVADALNCNCSLLMSSNVGGASIMKTEQYDIIENVHDISILADKIEYLFNHPNADRLLSSVDISDCSEKSSYIKLKKHCDDLLKES